MVLDKPFSHIDEVRSDIQFLRKDLKKRCTHKMVVTFAPFARIVQENSQFQHCLLFSVKSIVELFNQRFFNMFEMVHTT